MTEAHSGIMDRIDTSEIVRLVQNEVNEEAACRYRDSSKSYGPDASAGWKAALYGALERLLNSYGVEVIFTKASKRKPEFMLDLVGALKDDAGYYRRFTVGVECEWHVKSKVIERDFVKLMAFRAPLKILVYSCGVKGRPKVREMIERSLNRFEQHVSGDRYLLIEVYKKKGRWQGQAARVYDIDQNGLPRIARVFLDKDT